MGRHTQSLSEPNLQIVHLSESLLSGLIKGFCSFIMSTIFAKYWGVALAPISLSPISFLVDLLFLAFVRPEMSCLFRVIMHAYLRCALDVPEL